MEEEFNLENALATKEKIVVMYTAKWCTPCKELYPIFDTMKEKYPGITFGKIDVDKHPELCRDIDVIPNCKFFYRGREWDSFTGSKPDLLENLVADLNKYVPHRVSTSI